MSNGVTGGNFATVADLQASSPKINTIVQLINGERFAVTSTTGNYLLANGLYATRIQEPRPSIEGMPQETFEANQNANKNKYAGSGAVEFGKQRDSASNQPVNQGMFGKADASNSLVLGCKDANKTGSSSSDVLVVNINGVVYTVDQGNSNFRPFEITLPPAPDGTETYDKTTSTYVQHASSAIAFASETATNKVITERSDLVVIKVVEAVDLSNNAAFPLGNMQYDASTYEGVSLQNNNTPQSLSAFGSWDSTTTGYSAVLDETNTASFVQKAENNIRSDDGVLKQNQYKILSHKGMYNYASADEAMAAFGYTLVEDNANLWTDGTDFYLFITLVSRLNQGLKHQEFNDNGTKKAIDNNFWYNTGTTFTSKADCFDPSKLLASSGNIASSVSGRPSNDPYQYHDAIYAGLVEDLRISCRRQDYSRLIEDSVRKDIAGTTRGKGKVPFTKVFSSVGAVTSDYTIVNQDSASAVVAEKQLPTVYDEIPMTAIGGDPSDILSTFPDGVSAAWLGLLDGTDKELIGKANTTTVDQVYTNDNGTSWTSGTTSIDSVTNEVTTTLTSGSVVLFSYPVLSNTTEPANRGAVSGNVGDVVSGNANQIERGNRMAYSLADFVGTGTNTAANPRIYSVLDYQVENTNFIEDNDSQPPTHRILDLKGDSSNLSGFKALYTLTEKDGLLYMQYFGRELKYDGSSWGDDSTIPIGNNDYTVTDDNGQTVKAFCHHSLIPIGIAHNE